MTALKPDGAQIEQAKNAGGTPQFLQIVAKPKPAAKPKAARKLTRVAFRVSRLMEFCTERELIAGGRQPPSKRVGEAWIVTGRGSGKSRMAAAISCYLGTFVKHKLVKGETGHSYAQPIPGSKPRHIRLLLFIFI
jgi:hypothetical protein